VKLRYSLTEQSYIVDVAVQGCVAQVLTKVVIHSEIRPYKGSNAVPGSTLAEEFSPTILQGLAYFENILAGREFGGKCAHAGREDEHDSLWRQRTRRNRTSLWRGSRLLRWRIIE